MKPLFCCANLTKIIVVVVAVVCSLSRCRWAYGVVVSMFDFHRSDRGSNPAVVAVKFHVYDYTIERHPWQLSENHKPRVHPSHVREIG